MPKVAGTKLTSATWWGLGLLLAAMATLASNWIPMLAICFVTVTAILIWAPATSRPAGLKLYGSLAAGVIVIRILFRIIFNQPSYTNVLLPLPRISIELGALNIGFLGPVSGASLQSALTDGLRLAAIILAVAMANSIANPRRLLRLAPSALYEFATAAAVALNLAPQLIVSLQRVRRARALRGASHGLRGTAGLVIPVLEDTVNRSLDLAASMDSRGFGRRGIMSTRVLAATRLAAAGALVIFGTSVYLLVSSATAPALVVTLLLVGVGLLATSLKLTAMHRVRTRLVLEKQRLPDHLVLLVAALIAIAFAAKQVAPPMIGVWLP